MLDAVAWRRPAGEPEGDYIFEGTLGVCAGEKLAAVGGSRRPEEEEEEGAGSDSVNDNDDNEAAAAHEAGTRREPPLRTVVNDEPYVQWVAATRVSLALARDQAEVDAAESKESGSSSDDKGVGEEDGGQGVEMVETSTVAEIPFSDSEDEASADSEHEEAGLLGRNAGRGGGGETKRRGCSSPCSAGSRIFAAARWEKEGNEGGCWKFKASCRSAR